MPDASSFRPDLFEAEAACAASGSEGDAPLSQPDRPWPSPGRPRRRWRLPLVLFALTCLSTFMVGATQWTPMDAFFQGGLPAPLKLELPDPYSLIALRLAVLAHWQDGLSYMACVLAILLSHEMGHFVTATLYRVRVSPPYFIPMPMTVLGTMGAVIAMEGSQADRRQIFDIGLAGPLAGLVVAIPIAVIGVWQMQAPEGPTGGDALQFPLALRLLADWLHPGLYDPQRGLPITQLNPFLMAGWVGLLVTGLNMMPVSQLDGGHVTYALFGRGAHVVARLFMVGAFSAMAVAYVVYRRPPLWLLMALLVLLIGTDHPPTRDDRVPLGLGRVIVGLLSLLIPVLCFAPDPFR